MQKYYVCIINNIIITILNNNIFCGVPIYYINSYLKIKLYYFQLEKNNYKQSYLKLI